jgi:hypothetical protein
MSQLHISTFTVTSALLLVACPTDDSRPQTPTGETGSVESGDTTGTNDEGPPMTTSEGTFVPGDVLSEPTCDPWMQDCPEGEKCVAYNKGGETWNANKCVPTRGTGKAGDECRYDGSSLGTDDCDVGFMCYYTDAEGVGSCVPQCAGAPDQPQCPAEYNCSIANDGTLVLCIYACDPILQDCAPAGSGCFWDGSRFNCDPAGDLLEESPCGYVNDCSPGHYCLSAESLPSCGGSACCTGFCDLSNPQCGVANTECIAFFDDNTAPPGLENTGICALPG